MYDVYLSDIAVLFKGADKLSYQDDKRELLKLKQGVIEESETIHEEEKPVYELHGMKKVENFFYHYKWHVIVGIFFAAVLAFLVVTTLQKEQGDMRVLVVAKDGANATNLLYKVGDIENAFELYCRDYDDNGYIHVEVYNIDLSDNADPNYMLSAVTKVTSEIMYGEAQLYMVDKAACEAMTNGHYEDLYDLGALYPDCPYIDGPFLHVKESSFARNANYLEGCPDDLYMVVRKVTDSTSNLERCEKAQKKALEVIDNIVSGKFEGWIDDQGRIYGLKNED